MINTTTKAKRGMVFWCNPYQTGKNNAESTHVQKGRRPYLVVSNDACNTSSPIVNICPMTTSSKASIPSHVVFTDSDGNRNTILTEQVTTVDATLLESYRYSLSEDVMVLVDRALAIQFGLSKSIRYTEEYQSISESIGDIIEDIIRVRYTKIHSESKDSLLSNVTSQLEKTLTELVPQKAPTVEPKKEETAEQKKITSQLPNTKREPMSQVEKFNKRYGKFLGGTDIEASKPSHSNDSPQSSARNGWDDSKREEYLRDFENLPIDEVMTKWKLSTKKSAQQTKYNCQKRLGKR